MSNSLRMIIGTVIGALVGILCMQLLPVGIQPGDVLAVGLGGGQETELRVPSENRGEQIAEVVTEEGKKGRALVEQAQSAGFIQLPNSKQVYIAGKTPAQAAELLAKESGEQVVSVRVTQRNFIAVLPPFTNLVFTIGRLFSNLLTMLIVPFIVCSVIVAISKLGDLRKLGAMAGQTLLFFALSMIGSAILGLVIVNVMRPGAGVDLGTATAAWALPQMPSAQEWLIRAVPANPIEAIVRPDVIGVMVLAVIIGSAMLRAGAASAIGFFAAVNQALTVFSGWLMWAAPLGVSALIAAYFAGQDSSVMSSTLQSMGGFVGCTAIALALAFVLLMLFSKWWAKSSPAALVKSAMPALLTALGTGSTPASLPMILSSAKESKVPQRVSGFVVPAGVGLQMCGTVAFQVVATLFLAQALGVSAGPAQQAAVALLAVFSSVASLNMPGGAVATLSLPLTACGVPLSHTGMLYLFDRPLEMLRAVPNAFGTLVACKVIQSRGGEMVGEEGLEPPTSSL